ncbi:MAG: DUF4266 domain-containing protein [Pseudomonadota bacterium]
MILQKLGTFILMMLLLGSSGCSTIKPWERGNLARDDMQWRMDPLTHELHTHVYFAKEASTGEAGSGAGGCGCN